MLYHIAKNWRLFVLRGVIAIAFGVMALFWPQLTMAVLILLFAIYAVLEGLLAPAIVFGALPAYLGLRLRRVVL